MMDDELRRRIEKTYSQATKDVTDKFEKYMADFARKDAVKRDLVERKLMTEAEYATWRKGQVLIGERWQEMRDVLATDLTNADRIAMSITNGYLPEAYALGHNYGTFQIERASCINTSYTLYSRETVERLIKDEPRLLPVTKWEIDAPKDLRWNQQHITQQITQGILQGESLPKVAKRLERVVGMDERAAMRNARTALTGAQNAGRVDAYRRANDLGIKTEKEWLATMDTHTRDSHIDMDGEHVPVDSQFSNGMDYPGGSGPPEEVYNCRCTLIPRVVGTDYSESDVLRWRNDDLGDMDYDAWKASHAGHTNYHAFGDSFKSDNVSQKNIDNVNRLYKKLDQKYHAVIANVQTTLEKDQSEYDLYYRNCIADMKKQYPNKRNSTLERMAKDVLGPRPESVSIFKGGDFSNQSRVLTLNPSVLGHADGLNGDIQRKIEHAKRNAERAEIGRRIRPLDTVGSTFESNFLHEYGHAIDFTYGISDNKDFLEFYNSFTEKEISLGVSGYAATNPQEFIAECFCDSFMGEAQSDISKAFMEKLGGWIK